MSPSHPQQHLDADILGLGIAIVHCSRHYCSLLVLHFHTWVCFSRWWLKLSPQHVDLYLSASMSFLKENKAAEIQQIPHSSSNSICMNAMNLRRHFRSGNKIRKWNPSILLRIRETWREIFPFIIYIQTRRLHPFVIKRIVAHCTRWQLAAVDAIEKKHNTSCP